MKTSFNILKGKNLDLHKSSLEFLLEGQRNSKGIFKNMSPGYLSQMVFSQKDPAFITLSQGDNIIGATGIFTKEHYLYSNKKANSACITCVGILEEFRNQGLGRKMIQEVNNYLRSSNFDMGILFTDNIYFFEFLGWKILNWNYKISNLSQSSNPVAKIIPSQPNQFKRLNKIYEKTSKDLPLYPVRKTSYLKDLNTISFSSINSKKPYKFFNSDNLYCFFKSNNLLGYAYVERKLRKDDSVILNIQDINATEKEFYPVIRDTLISHFNINQFGSFLSEEHPAYNYFHPIESTENIKKCGKEEPSLFKEHFLILPNSSKSNLLINGIGIGYPLFDKF